MEARAFRRPPSDIAETSLFALIDALKTPGATWQRAGQNQMIWVIVILFAGIFGAILYFVIPRRALKAASI